MDMMKEAKLKKLKELKRMLQGKMLEAVMPGDVESIVSDNINPEGEEYEEEMQGEGLEGEGREALEEGLLEMMQENMRGRRGSDKKTDFRVMPPKPSISISVSTMSKPMKGKKRRKV